MILTSRLLVFSIGLAVLFSACGQQVFEAETCVTARDRLKRLYATHLGNLNAGDDRTPRDISDYLSKRLRKELEGQDESKTDYLTRMTDVPDSARVGRCNATQTGLEFEVIIYRKTEEENIEERVRASVIEDAGWVLDRVAAY